MGATMAEKILTRASGRNCGEDPVGRRVIALLKQEYGHPNIDRRLEIEKNIDGEF